MRRMSENEKLLVFLKKFDIDHIPIKGGVQFTLKDSLGKLLGAWFAPNTITDRGDMVTADYATDRSEPQINWMGVGTVAGGKTTASDALEAEVTIAGNHKLCSSRTQGASADDNDAIWVCTFAAGEGTGTLIEAGLFNVVSGPGMVAYQEGFTITKAAGDSLVGTWTITYGVS